MRSHRYIAMGNRKQPHHGSSRSRVEELLRSALVDLLPPVSHQERTFGGIELPHSLFEFQADGVKFLLSTMPGALLADDMGLGKTVQAIVAMRVMMRLGELTRALVIAPKSVQASWMHHFHDWSPEIRAVAVAGDRFRRSRCWLGLSRGEFDVGVITYESFRNDAESEYVTVPNFDLLVADEIQKIKNPSTKAWKAVQGIEAVRRWGLTGTPLENQTSETTAILHVLDASVPPSVEQPQLVKAFLDPRMKRRRKDDVLDELPALISSVDRLYLSPRQRQVYEKAESDGIADLKDKPRNITNIFTLITRLKQICNGVDGDSAKLDWLYDYVEGAVAGGDKVLVFSQYTETVDSIERRLYPFAPLRYTGNMQAGLRDAVVRDFETSDQRVLILSTRAGGLGLNLQAANHVVHFDSWWNPAIEAQATARAHRIGQAKTVFDRTLVSVDTIEERIQELLSEKRALFREIVDDLSVEGLSQHIGVDEMYGLFNLDTRQR